MLSSFGLKIIAIISMVFDHTGYVIYGHFSWMNDIGRLAFPIFAFSVTEGYAHTSNLKKYFIRLLIFAILSQIPYMLFLSVFTSNFMHLNILFTLILGLLTITVYEKQTNPYLKLLVVLICSMIAQFLFFDYGWYGIAIIMIFHVFKNKKIGMNVLFIFATCLNYFYHYIITLRTEYLYIPLFCCLSLIPINSYNGQKGKNIKYLLYFFYPLHLVILYLVHSRMIE